jgi:uncharacterized protein (DUF58 family)
VVEGTMVGLNRSPFHGFSVEFAEHRPYSWGDDLRHVDWKLWARADRYYVKLYEEDTNLRVWLLVDSSDSMRYRSEAMSKYDYACTLAAALAYLLVGQRDAVGLAAFDNAVRYQLEPGSTEARVSQICRALEETGPARRTALGPVLHEVSERVPPRGVVVLLSDLLAPAEDVISGLRHLRYNRHDVIVFHVLDPAELRFPFDGNVMFEGLEVPDTARLDARQVREAYLEAMGQWRGAIRGACGNREADYCLADTSEPPGHLLARFLVGRQGQPGIARERSI